MMTDIEPSDSGNRPARAAQREPDIAAWRAAIRRGRSFLAAQVCMSPSFGKEDADVNWFCKTPWALAVTGDRAAALRSLRLVDLKILRSGKIHHPAETQWTNAVSYALGWLVAGAQACEAYDLARRFDQELARYVCPSTGGLFSVVVDRSEERPYFDLAIQGALIHASISMGNIPRARGAGDQVLEIIDRQPNPSQFLYNYYHPNLGFLTELTEATRQQRCFERGRPRQPFANVGFVLQGLARLFDATGDLCYRDGCVRLLQILSDLNHDDLISHSQNHKVAHAALMLHRQTGDSRYLETALPIAHRIAKNIDHEGRAWADVTATDILSQTHFFTIRTTCDSVLWLEQICDELEANGTLGENLK